MVVLPCSLHGRGALLSFSHAPSPHASCISFLTHGPTSVCSSAVIAGARGLYMEVETAVKKYCTMHSKGSYQTVKCNQ